MTVSPTATQGRLRKEDLPNARAAPEDLGGPWCASSPKAMMLETLLRHPLRLLRCESTLWCYNHEGRSFCSSGKTEELVDAPV